MIKYSNKSYVKREKVLFFKGTYFKGTVLGREAKELEAFKCVTPTIRKQGVVNA